MLDSDMCTMKALLQLSSTHLHMFIFSDFYTHARTHTPHITGLFKKDLSDITKENTWDIVYYSVSERIVKS